MSKSFHLSFIIAGWLLVFVLSTASNAMAQTLAGNVNTVNGNVKVERAGVTKAVTAGMALDVGDRIVTGPNSRVTITLTDKSKLELDESTSMVIDEQVYKANTRKTKLSLFSGLVRSFVSYTSSQTPHFEVHTPNAVASARGTEYDTETDNKPRKNYKDCRRFTQVSVYKGTVQVTNSTNPGAGSVEVPPGHKTLVACGYAPLPPSEIGAAAAAALGGGSTAGLLLGNGIVIGGTVGGLAAGGVFSGGSGHAPTHPKSPSQ